MRGERFNTWPLVRSLLAGAPRRLEVASGLRPRLPMLGTQFVDSSEPAVTKLRRAGAQAVVGSIAHLPFEDGAFDLVAAFDVIEHIEDDEGAISELTRVAAPGATLLLSAPLHPALWTEFDALVGHCRRYEPEELTAKLARSAWTIASSAAYGMQPRPSPWFDWAMGRMRANPARALWIYDRIIMPIGALLQKRLVLEEGLMSTDDVDEILLVCVRA